MKKLSSLLLTFILILNINFSSSVFAATDNTIYIPKIVNADNGNKLVYVPELAEIGRKISSDSYGIEKGATTSIAKTMKNEGFVDIQIRVDTSKSLGDLPENFLVGVKNFKVNGKENHILAIAFRGTDLKASLMDALIDGTTDVLYVDLNGFHSGFCGAASSAFNILYNEISFSSLKNSDGSNMTFRDYLDCCKDGKEGYYIFVTGHSLGGAIANIFAGDILSGFGVKSNAMCYTFGTPTVCSKSKAKTLNAYNVFNIINTKDPIPKAGYNISEGVRLGKDLKQTVSAGILLDNHAIADAYKTTTALVRNNIDSLYKYTLSFYDKWSKETKTVNGQHTHNYYYNDGKCYCGAVKASTQQSNAASTLKINLTKYPVQHTQGNNFGLRGTISSNYKIKKIYGYIKQNGNVIQSTEDSPNAKSVDVRDKKLNNNLVFETLGAGNYTLEVCAVDASGNSITVTKNFTVVGQQVKAESTLSINLDKYPVTLNAGSGFGLRGSVTSNYSIALVRGYVINSSGQTVLSSKDTPNSTSMDIRYANLNDDLVFNNLGAGNYTMKVVATDNSGRTVEVSKAFSVDSNTGSNNSTLSINLVNYPVTLNVGSSYGLRGSITSNYNISVVRGYVINSNGQTVLSSKDTPNSTYMDIKPAHLNADLIFNNLSAGSYTMRVVAVDASGRTVEASKNFTVKADVYVDNSPNGNGVTGTVSIPSSWENLSIRSGPSTNYQIVGSMNNGAKCTVYPNKTSNGWYYVNYNGIWGYASGNQINLHNASTSNTRTGIVNIPSSWTDLSIRTGPSTNYQIVGGMPQGSRCTVYPDKASNGWYYVEYNGVSGYAAGNRINLQ